MRFNMENILRKAQNFFAGPKRRSVLAGRKAASERRRLKRMACHQSFLCSKGGDSHPITVVDVGFGGFRVRADKPLGKRGDLLHLRRISTDFRRHMTGAYTTGMMARVAWVKEDEDGHEAGLYLPEAPGSMRISWFRELLKELDLDEKSVFSQRTARRHRCKLPGSIAVDGQVTQNGTVFDLSAGGGLFGTTKAATMGAEGDFEVVWGAKTLRLRAEVVGVRQGPLFGQGPGWLHSLKFQEELPKEAEQILYRWLDELSRNEQ